MYRYYDYAVVLRYSFLMPCSWYRSVASATIRHQSVHLERTWSPNYDEFDPSRLRDELADTFVLLCALATRFEVDLGEAVAAKFVVKDVKREWKSARS